MKILITNTVTLNTGDAAILLGVIDTLRATFGKEIQLVIYDNQPDVAAKYYPELEFRKWPYLNLSQPPRIKYLGRILRYLNFIRIYFAAWCWSHRLSFLAKFLLIQEEQQDISQYHSADLIVSTGGTYLVENYSLEPRIFDYQLSLLLQRPLVFFTQSLGPFSVPQNRKSLKGIFEKSCLILLRDRKSLDNVLELETKNANLHVTADAAFALADAAALKVTQEVKPLSDPPRIAISVRDWKHFKTIDPAIGREKYLEAVRAVTIHLVEKYGAKITYISTCQGIPEYWTNDSKVASEVIEKLPSTVADSVTLDVNFHSPNALAEILKSYDFVISTRLHMAILALGVGVPVLPIAYEFKTQELFKNLGQGRWVLDIEEICSESLIGHVDDFLASLSEIRKPLFQGVDKERKRSLASGVLVKKAFEQWHSRDIGKQQGRGQTAEDTKEEELIPFSLSYKPLNSFTETKE